MESRAYKSQLQLPVSEHCPGFGERGMIMHGERGWHGVSFLQLRSAPVPASEASLPATRSEAGRFPEPGGRGWRKGSVQGGVFGPVLDLDSRDGGRGTESMRLPPLGYSK